MRKKHKPLHAYSEDALLYAPMEGITCPAYRKSVMDLFGEWDKFATDFLRIPTQGKFKTSHYIEHVGKEIFENEQYMQKTVFQILTTPLAQTLEGLSTIKQLGIKHLDLNLGCPSRKVNSHGGGAVLMSDLANLEKVVGTIRENFDDIFTVKIRVGYRDASLFEDAIRILNDINVDAITIHARTRDELYKGRADWSYIRKAVSISNVPIIANGDVWTLDDIKNVKNETGCHGIMFGRSALKTPWLAKLWHLHQSGLIPNDERVLLSLRSRLIPLYYAELEKNYRKHDQDDYFILKRFKAVSRYLYEDYPEDEKIKSCLMRTKSLENFKDSLSDVLGGPGGILGHFAAENIFPTKIIPSTVDYNLTQ